MINVNKDYNYGVAILRALLCFLVIVCHYWDTTDISGAWLFLSYLRSYAVLVFMLIAFFYSQKFLSRLDKKKVFDRFERLIVPQISWAVIYWLIYCIVDRLVGTNLQDGFKDLLWQIFTGHSPHLNSTMWYQVDLLLLTALFSILVYLLKDKADIAICFIAIGAIIIQYTGVNSVFSEMRYELKYPLGRLAEMIPVAALGYLIASKRILKHIEKYRILIIISSIFMLVINYKYKFFGEIDGYGYQGIEGILVATILFTCFFLIPLQKVNSFVKNWIIFISKYTMGIYCMHRLVGTMLSLLINHYNINVIKENSLTECFIIYIICYVCSWIGINIFKNTKLKLIFS